MNEKKDVYSKLAEVQAEVGAITKDSVNPFFKNKYFDINKLLEVVKPILAKKKLILLQPLKVTEQGNVLETIILNSENGKDRVESSVLLPEGKNAQDTGSIITYFRRYSLQSLLALQAEDDDGNSTTQPQPQTTQKKDPVRKAKPGNPASQKQIDFIKSLGKKKGVNITEDFLGTLDSQKASDYIERLNKMDNSASEEEVIDY